MVILMKGSKMLLTVKTSELQLGDIVLVHGARILIDSPLTVSRNHPIAADGSRCQYVAGLFLNRDETSEIPRGWTIQADGSHRWTIQGNDLASWRIEREGV